MSVVKTIINWLKYRIPESRKERKRKPATFTMVGETKEEGETNEVNK